MGSKAFPPREQDGRINVVNAPMTKGWWTWFCGAADDPNPTPPSSGRGEGTKLNFDFTGPDSKEVILSFNEPIEVHDGQLFYTPVANWDIEDRLEFEIRMPANTVTVNGTGAGNCNAVDTGQGYNVIVPSYGGPGGHDIVLASAIPVTADGAGYWNVDRDTGEITPGLPGESDWHLIDIQISVHFMKNMPMGHPMGVLDIDAYKSEWIHNNWQLVAKIVKVSAGAGKAAGWLLTYRQDTT